MLKKIFKKCCKNIVEKYQNQFKMYGADNIIKTFQIACTGYF